MTTTLHTVPNYKHTLAWTVSEELGQYGWLPPDGSEPVYTREYFEKYKKYEDTEIGKNIRRARTSFVLGNLPVEDFMVYTDLEISICDVGIGSGIFIKDMSEGMLRGKVFGSDVNPYAIEWLKEKGLLIDPTKTRMDVITLWDVLEHMNEPEKFITDCDATYVFVSMPIYKDVEHVLKSKHLRPNEHLWYYTEESLINIFKTLGYNLLQVTDTESLVGREDILSFAFKKL